MDGTWTIGELAQHAAAALAADGAVQASGRVRDLPNTRLIRWYTTIGLLDPPLGRRGRTALYGPRHLLQLVAVKRRQAEGRSIAEIQLELAAATTETLTHIAALPPGLDGTTPHAGSPPDTGHTVQDTNTFRAPPSTADANPVEASATSPAQGGSAADGRALLDVNAAEDPAGAPVPARRTDTAPGHGAEGANAAETGGSPAREGSEAGPGGPGADMETADSVDAPAGPENEGAGERGAFWRARPDVSYSPATVAADYGRPIPLVVQGVRLAPGLTLLLDGPALSDDDLAAIDAAARPLLDELHRRGLVTTVESPARPPADHFRRSP